MQDQSSELPVCPSFNSYSSDGFVDIAAKVSREFADLGLGSSDGGSGHEHHNEDEDFEFVSLSTAGDEVFINGPIGPVFPVFNRDLLSGGYDDRRRDRLGGDDEIPGPPSSSSSEADELDGIPSGTYCVWTPKGVPPTPGRCRKSKSTGSSSKRWSFRELLRRCNSDGKESSFVFLTPSSSSKKVEEKVSHEKITSVAVNRGGSSGSASNNGRAKMSNAVKSKPAVAVGKAVGNNKMIAAHEVFYVRNRELNRNAQKRRSFLPYRQDLVGFFANVNTMGRSFPPF
ncbi:uncharacterized protein LOC133818155 [Humulus lupulus]|uniref:uncharacterized protein LOC133818155 n=1 Tax=Humulus lupulus TaxID=3486 RepID=UPI002B402183|nr:uncharacterized protein LOC133818155 [Humulus lupulus]